MSTAAFGLGVLVTATAGVVAVLSSRVSERLRIPAPAFFLIAAAAVADLWPRLGGLSFTAVDQVVSVALAVILFDGGMRVGWRRMKSVAGPTLWIGVAGTLVTAGGVAVLAHLILALDWRSALLLGAALARAGPGPVRHHPAGGRRGRGAVRRSRRGRADRAVRRARPGLTPYIGAQVMGSS
jgi:cell volume regulation protein A